VACTLKGRGGVGPSLDKEEREKSKGDISKEKSGWDVPTILGLREKKSMEETDT